MVGYSITMGGWVYESGDEFIHDPASIDRQVHDASVNLRADGVSTLTFTMPPTHPLISEIEILKFGNTDKSISVYFNDTQLFHGTVVSKAEDMNGELTVTCKDDLFLLEAANIYLLDPTIIASHASGKWYATLAINEILDQYNDVAPQELRISAATIPDVGYVVEGYPDKYLDVPSGSSMSALDVLKSVFADGWGCTLRVKFSEQLGKLRLYVSNASPEASQTVRFGENLTDYESEASAEPTYTAVMPVGKNYTFYTRRVMGQFRLTRSAAAGTDKLYGTIVDSKIPYVMVLVADGGYTYKVKENSYGSEIYLGVTPEIAETMPAGTLLDAWQLDDEAHKVTRPTMLDRKPDGTYSGYRKKGVYLYNESAVERYGVRTQVIDVPDEGHINNLMKIAAEALSKHPVVGMTLDIKAVDMALLSDDYQHLAAGDMVRVVSEPHGVDTTLMVSSMSLNLDNPAETNYVLGIRQSSMSGKVERTRLNLAIMENNVLYRMQTT